MVPKTPNETSTPDAELAVPSSQAERISLLGIPDTEMTDSVKLALSALFEKLDDMARDLKSSHESFAELERLVDVDCVAPVPNRRAFMRRLAWAISMLERYGHPCSIIYFDLNDFKRINDTYGHAAGDMAIRHISKIFTESLRVSDFTARLSGDEFAILMYYANAEAAQERGVSIAHRVENTPFAWRKNPIPLSIAHGIYEIRKGEDPESALSNADTAMYIDKRRMKERAGGVSA